MRVFDKLKNAYTYINTRMFCRARKFIYTHTNTCTYLTGRNTRAHTYMHTQTHTYMHTQTHTYMHTQTHTYMHTHMEGRDRTGQGSTPPSCKRVFHVVQNRPEVSSIVTQAFAAVNQVYIHACICICMYVCMYVCLYIHVYVYICARA